MGVVFCSMVVEDQGSASLEISVAKLRGMCMDEKSYPYRRTQVKLLSFFAEFCKANHLQYWLDFGTLLGAVRHNGHYIPWDDDIDVSMPMSDWKRLKKLAAMQLNGPIRLFDMSDYALDYRCLKLMDCRTFYCEAHTSVDIPCGIFIDIFPYVAVPNVPASVNAIWIRALLSTWRRSGVCLRRNHRWIAFKVYDVIEATFYRLLYFFLIFFYRVIAAVIQTRKIGCIFVGNSRGMEVDKMFPLGTIMFEGEVYSAPREPERLLEVEYGNWQQLPPEGKRATHACIVCENQSPDAEWVFRNK